MNGTLLLGALTVIALLLPHDPLAQVTAITGIIVVTGAFVFQLAIRGNCSLLQRTMIAIGLGLFVFLAVGAIAGIGLHAAGIQHPLTRVPLLVIWCAVLAGIMLTAAIRSTDPVGDVLGGISRRHVAWTAVLAVPPSSPCWAWTG